MNLHPFLKRKYVWELNKCYIEMGKCKAFIFNDLRIVIIKTVQATPR